MIEEWVGIQGFPNYQLSNLGCVRSLNHKSGTSCFLSSYDCEGYRKIDLYRGGVRHKRFVHILVASSFVPNPHNLPEVNHKDGDRRNARSDNLEWTTSRGNKAHARDVLLSQMGDPPRSVVLRNIADGSQLEFCSVAEAARSLKISRTNLLGVIAGSRKTVSGFVVVSSKVAQ